jgi:hypothetical protein
MDPMLSEISNLKAIFKESIIEFDRLNMKYLTDLIYTLLELQTSALQGSLTADAHEIFSPPKKPNLSPIPSAKRLSTSSAAQSNQGGGAAAANSYMTFSPEDLQSKMLKKSKVAAGQKNHMKIQITNFSNKSSQ